MSIALVATVANYQCVVYTRDSKLRREEEEGEKLATYIVLTHVTLVVYHS